MTKASLLALMDKVEDIAGIAAEAVKAGHHQFVARPQELQNGRQLGPAVPTASRHLLRADHATAFGFEFGELDVEILVEGADAGVTDAGHGVSPQVLGPRLPCHK